MKKSQPSADDGQKIIRALKRARGAKKSKEQKRHQEKLLSFSLLINGSHCPMIGL